MLPKRHNPTFIGFAPKTYLWKWGQPSEVNRLAEGRTLLDRHASVLVEVSPPPQKGGSAFMQVVGVLLGGVFLRASDYKPCVLLDAFGEGRSVKKVSSLVLARTYEVILREYVENGVDVESVLLHLVGGEV